MPNPRRMLAGALAIAALVLGVILLVVEAREPDVAELEQRESATQAPERGEALEGGSSTAVRTAALPPEAPPDQVPDPPPVPAQGVEEEALDDAAPVQASGTLVVELLSAGGGALGGEGSSVELERDGHDAPGSRRTGPGTFAFEGLAPGPWTVRGSAAAHDDTTRDVVVPEDGTALSVELVLAARPAVRIVVLTPDGEPFAKHLERHMAAPRAIATRERPERFASELVAPDSHDACGFLHASRTAGLDARCVGLLELACEPPLWINLALGVDVLESRRLERVVDELVFTLDPAEIENLYPVVTLTAVDAATGQLLGANANMKFGFWNGAHVSGGSRELGLGRYRFDGLPGPARLELRHAGYDTVRLDVVLPRSPEHDLGTIAMKPIETGTLVVVLDAPAGLERVSLDRAPLDAFEGGAPLRTWNRDLPDARGEVRTELGVGRWVLWAEGWRDGRRHAARRRIVDVAPGERRIDLALVPCPDVVLRAPSLRHLRVLLDEADVCVAGPTTCDAEGRTLQLAPGAYRVAIDGGLDREPTPFVVGPQGATVDLP